MIKPSEKNIEDYQKSLSMYEAKFNELKEVYKIKESEWWKIRQRILGKKLENIERHLDNFQKMSERDILLYLAERVMIRTELKTEQDLETEILVVDKKIQDLREKINDRRQRL